MSSRLAVTAFVAILAIAGCEAKQVEKAVPTVSSSPTRSTAAFSTAALSRLEEADKLDGKPDHVVGKCYVCSLGMDGSEKFAVNVDGYSCHLCSKSCQQDFEKSTEEIIISTSIPTEPKPE